MSRQLLKDADESGHERALERAQVNSRHISKNALTLSLAQTSVLFLGLLAAAMGGLACNDKQGHTAIEVTNSDCIACHRDEYEKAVAPIHVSSLPLTCEGCHSYESWEPARGSDHDAYFPLKLAHAKVNCGTCHRKGFESGATSSKCFDCHQDDYDAALNPPHDGFSTNCQECHTPAGWTLVADGSTGFVHSWPLEGNHAAAACTSCHLGDPPVYAGTPKDCVACHQADYDGATNPSHDGFSTDCATCHTPDGWKGAVAGPGFVHSWPLNGTHASAACTSCHLGNPPVYAGTPTKCVDCHANDRDAATPPHDGFSDDCASCHNETSFKPSTFDHPWPLTGAHDSAACAGCHTGNPPAYAGTPTDCVACHQADYDSSPYPGHNTFPTDCVSCHTTTAWTPASGGHPEDRFPITGRHNYACMDCHDEALGPMGKDNTDCVGCHTGAHTRSTMDSKHTDVSNYPSGTAPPNFCLDCHPKG